MCLKAQANFAPLFTALPKLGYTDSPQASGWVVHETDDSFIVASTLTFFNDFNYYFVQTPDTQNLTSLLNVETPIILTEPNRFVIVQIEHPDELQELAERVHERGGFCGMIQKISPYPVDPIKLEPPVLPRFSLLSEDKIRQILTKVAQEPLLSSIQTMESWQSRHHQDNNGQQTGQHLRDIYLGLVPEDRDDVVVEIVDHRGTEQKSVRVKILGSENPEKVLILGSHLDSINPRDNSHAPGADDNASGTATNLEIFRVLMEQEIRLKKTLEIHAYAAEEIGLVGSQEMAESYKRNSVQVEAMVQFDMNGYTRDAAKVYFVANGTNATLSADLGKLVNEYLNIESQSSFLMFGSSDHASWHRQGFPVAFPTENPRAYNRQIHTENDTLSGINSPEQIVEFTRLGLAYVLHYAQ